MVDQIAKPGLAPNATPINTVAKPRQYQAGALPIAPTRPQAPTPLTAPALEETSGYRLGQTLQVAAPAFGKFLADRYNNELDEKSKVYQSTFASMDAKEAEDFYAQESQNVSDASLRALRRTYGVRKAYADMQTLKESIERGEVDLATTSVDDALDQYMESSVNQIEDSEYQEAYREAVAEFAPKFRAAQSAFMTDKFAKDRDDAVFGAVLDTVEYAGQTGGDPNEAVRNLYTAFGPGSPFNMEPRALDALVIEAAESLALQGKYNEVDSLLNSERVGKNGEKIPSLARNRTHGGRVQQILRAAQRYNQEDAKDHYNSIEFEGRTAASSGSFDAWAEGKSPDDYKAIFGESWPATVDALRSESARVNAVVQKQTAVNEATEVEQRSLQRALSSLNLVYNNAPDSAFEVNLRLGEMGGKRPVPGYPDESVELPKGEELQKMFWENKMAEEFNSVDPNDPQAQIKGLNKATSVLIKSGYDYEPWKTEMSMAPLTVSNEDIKNGTIPDHLMLSYSKWSSFRAQGAGPLATKYAGEQSWFYEAVDLLPASVDIKQRMALVLRAKEANAGKPPEELNKAYQSEIFELNTKMFTNSDGKALDGPDNVMSIAPQYHTLYNTLRSVGTPKGDAIRAVQKRWSENVVTVNNQAYDISNLNVPGSELPDVIDFIGRKISEKYQGLGSPEEFFMIQNKEGNMYLPSFKGAGLLRFENTDRIDLNIGSKKVSLPLSGWTPNDIQLIRQAALYESQAGIELDKVKRPQRGFKDTPAYNIYRKYFGTDEAPTPVPVDETKTSGLGLISGAQAATPPQDTPTSFESSSIVKAVQPTISSLVEGGVKPDRIKQEIASYYDKLDKTGDLASEEDLRKVLTSLKS